jgi:phosphate transport system permease protein
MIRFLSSKKAETAFQAFGLLAITVSILLLAVLIVDIIIDAIPRLSPDFFTNYPSRRPSQAGIGSALVGSLYLMLITAAISLPIGVLAAVYLEEYARPSRLTSLIEININSLAGVPSIIYGILGLQLFVRVFGFGRSLIAGALTMALLVLPIIIISSREAIRRVPTSIRHAAYALGASKWEVTRDHVIPGAFPGVLTGCILAFSRAIGEAAPLITMGALTYVAFLPNSLFSQFTVLPIQAFNWVSRPQVEFQHNAAAAILVLLVVLVALNFTAVVLRHKFQRRVA